MKKFKLELSKREKIITASVILSLGLLSTQLVPFYLTYRFVIGLSVLATLLTVWALWEGLNITKAIVLIILPTLFTLSVASFYFLLPIRWLTRLPVALAFGLTFYTLLLSKNVFNVAATRTIPLYRVASTAVFVLTLITSFLLYNVIFSFDLMFLWNGLAVFLISFPLILQVVWSIKMEGINSLVLVYSLVLSLVIGEAAIALSFWPILNLLASLFLSTVLFIVLGISTHSLRDRLNRGLVWEYVGWGVLIFLIAFFVTSWVG